MRYPKFLPEGGKLGFVAPSFGCDSEPYRSAFASALEFFRARGFRTELGSNCFRSDGVGKSAPAAECGAEINEFFLRRGCDAILSVGGGETMLEDLPFFDFPAIASAEPRWYMGYSDNTNLTFTLPTLCDTAAIYGPCAPAFGMRPVHSALDDALALLQGRSLWVGNYPLWEREGGKDANTPLAPYNCTEPFAMRCFPAADDGIAFSGRLLGGCLDILSMLRGTRWDAVAEFNCRYAADGVIWFLEACDFSPMDIRRQLWLMRECGWFDGARGFLIGRPYRFDDDFLCVNRINAVTETLAPLGVPILLDVDLGHLPPMMPLICGALADVRATDNQLSIEMRLE